LQSNLRSARDKLRLLGILPEQIEDFERTHLPLEHVTLYAPIAGTVIEKNVRAGQYVKEGDLLYKIAELDPVWLYLEIYEYDIAWVRYGQKVDVVLEAMPGVTFQGMVTFVDPFLSESTRTVKVRVNLRNDERRLKPGMYASASISVPLYGDGGAAPTGLEGKLACLMHPEVIQDSPGTCRICQMKLTRIPAEGHFSMW
jgi:Cu(I)/Ag(I) efflux system membrane fusion protein